MILLSSYTAPVVLVGGTVSCPAGVSVQAVVSSSALALPVTSNMVVRWRRLWDMRLVPAAAGVVSLESATLAVVTNAVVPLYRALSPSSLTALADFNAVGLNSDWTLPIGSVVLAQSGISIIESVQGYVVVNNSGTVAVDVTTSNMALLMTVDLYDTPQYD